MTHAQDWDDAFSNSAYIAGSAALPTLWARNAADFRVLMADRMRTIAYGPHPRQAIDIFVPETAPVGLAVFVHGGYWLECAKEDWSDLAKGLLSRGYAVAIPSYRLAPDVGIDVIAQDVIAAVHVAANTVSGPIVLTGHSAGGHLVARIVSQGSGLHADVLARVKRVVPISGLFDLRRLRMTQMQDRLRITPLQAASESPALLWPHAAFKGMLHFWVGGDERPEFLRQSQVMALMWQGLAPITCTVQDGKHHFSILDDLHDGGSDLIRALTT